MWDLQPLRRNAQTITGKDVLLHSAAARFSSERILRSACAANDFVCSGVMDPRDSHWFFEYQPPAKSRRMRAVSRACRSMASMASRLSPTVRRLVEDVGNPGERIPGAVAHPGTPAEESAGLAEAAVPRAARDAAVRGHLHELVDVGGPERPDVRRERLRGHDPAEDAQGLGVRLGRSRLGTSREEGGRNFESLQPSQRRATPRPVASPSRRQNSVCSTRLEARSPQGSTWKRPGACTRRPCCDEPSRCPHRLATQGRARRRDRGGALPRPAQRQRTLTEAVARDRRARKPWAIPLSLQGPYSSCPTFRHCRCAIAFLISPASLPMCVTVTMMLRATQRRTISPHTLASKMIRLRRSS